MAGSLRTANYNLSKYAAGDVTSYLVDFNGNMDKIDRQMKTNADANAGTAGDIESIKQDVTALEEKTSKLENKVDTLEQASTTNEIVASKSSNVVSLVNNTYKTGDLIQGAMYAGINKTGDELSTIEYGNPGWKLVPLVLLSGNPLNLPIVSSPTQSSLMEIGTCILKYGSEGKLNVYNLILTAYYTGTNTIISIAMANANLVSTNTFEDVMSNICKKI